MIQLFVRYTLIDTSFATRINVSPIIRRFSSGSVTWQSSGVFLIVAIASGVSFLSLIIVSLSMNSRDALTTANYWEIIINYSYLLMCNLESIWFWKSSRNILFILHHQKTILYSMSYKAYKNHCVFYQLLININQL